MSGIYNKLIEQIRGRISILTQLANVDGELDMRELAFIYNVCIRNSIEVDSIANLISNPEPVISLEDLTCQQQESYLVDILSLMMIDGKVLPAEVNFVLGIGERLGFNRAAILAFIEEMMYESSVSNEYIRHRVGQLPRL